MVLPLNFNGFNVFILLDPERFSHTLPVKSIEGIEIISAFVVVIKTFEALIFSTLSVSNLCLRG